MLYNSFITYVLVTQMDYYDVMIRESYHYERLFVVDAWRVKRADRTTISQETSKEPSFVVLQEKQKTNVSFMFIRPLAFGVS